MDQDTQNMDVANGGQAAGNNNAMQNQPAPVAATGEDVSDHKLFAILGYIIPILFFLPMVQEGSKNNVFARFHANQQLVLLALWVVVSFVFGSFAYSIFGGLGSMIMSALNLVLLVLVVLGIINAAQGEMKELPVIGGFKLLDKIFK
jgi:uncharacterized membrane protein